MLFGTGLINLVLIKFVISLEIQSNPDDQYTNLNGNVIFPCLIKDYKEGIDYVEWCKNDFCTWGRTIRISDGRLRYKSLRRFYIIGNRSNGEWNLFIQNITANDVGKYKCTVTRRVDKNVFKINSSSASLRIMMKPTRIELNHKNSVEIILDQTENIECLVHNSVPEPNINWFMMDTIVFDQITEANSLNRLENIKLVENLNSSFQISTFKNSESVFINRLSLTDPPILSIDYEPKEPLEEGKTFTFHCKSESAGDHEKNDSKKKFFYLNEKYKFYSINGSIRLKLNRNMNSSLLVCEDNPPKFLNKPDSIVVMRNKTDRISLNCSVDSNPKSEIHWIKNFDQVIHIGESLNLSDNFDGEYECQAHSERFPPISSKVSLITEGPPLFIGQDTFFINSKKELDIFFNVLSSPSYESGPICFKMDKNNSMVIRTVYPSRENERFTMLQDDFKELKMSTRFKLVVRDANSDDEGFYNCTVGNGFGNGFYGFQVKRKSEPINALLTLALIIIFSILIFILILSIFALICMQRIRKDKVTKSLPSVSDHSGYEHNDKSTQQYQIYTCENAVFKEMSKNLSDVDFIIDRKIDSSFKKQSNQISLVVEQNSLESLSECVKFPSDTQNLILIDKLKSIGQSDLTVIVLTFSLENS
ncbi:irregular chiasm C-roughest isoform X1 [Brachionus plicatilis]|uniref:Irregular chiasm C-roughest isoform X1 n=1 Tax=Brachionus plicatilis TaxID=10195 RepID=A0A3M7SMT9_BRAPC|nr:irregular chiasm C-roughest isoform X1 [Brachionus plicatilis]